MQNTNVQNTEVMVRYRGACVPLPCYRSSPTKRDKKRKMSKSNVPFALLPSQFQGLARWSNYPKVIGKEYGYLSTVGNFLSQMKLVY